MGNKIFFKGFALFAIFYMALLSFAACNKQEQAQPEPTIIGEWDCLQCINTQQHWSFKPAGVAVQTYSAVGQPVWQNNYHYWASPSGDTLNMLNIESSNLVKWHLRFVGECLVEVHEVGGMLQPVQLLERTE